MKVNEVYVHDMDLVFTSKSGQKFYLGGIPEIYKDLGVEVVVNCVADSPINYDGIEILQIPFRDSTSWPEFLVTKLELKRWIKSIHALLDQRDVLIHCHAGMNRSALITVLYLWEYHRDEFEGKEEIIKYLKEARSPLLENSYFLKLIKEW
jgi:predicted protein tyrosine phosphatase